MRCSDLKRIWGSSYPWPRDQEPVPAAANEVYEWYFNPALAMDRNFGSWAEDCLAATSVAEHPIQSSMARSFKSQSAPTGLLLNRPQVAPDSCFLNQVYRPLPFPSSPLHQSRRNQKRQSALFQCEVLSGGGLVRFSLRWHFSFEMLNCLTSGVFSDCAVRVHPHSPSAALMCRRVLNPAVTTRGAIPSVCRIRVELERDGLFVLL